MRDTDSKTGTKSPDPAKAFEQYRDLPGVEMLIGLMSGMAPEAQEAFIDSNKRVFTIFDAMRQGLQQILSTEEGRKQFLEELQKRTGGGLGK